MKRAKIGNTEVNRDSYIFLLDTPLWQMRQSEVRIMSYLDLLQESANFATLESDILRIYNEMDKYYCIAKIVENLGDNEAYLINAFYVYNEALQNGAFDQIYIDEIERNNHVNEVVCNIVNDSINYTVSDDVVIDQSLWAWWQDNIINQNFYTDPRSGAKVQEKPNALPVSISGEVDYISTFKQSAICYTYTVVSADAIKESTQTAVRFITLFHSSNKSPYFENLFICSSLISIPNLAVVVLKNSISSRPNIILLPPDYFPVSLRKS